MLLQALMKYTEAIKELETIMETLRDPHVDIDELEAKVARAAELIEWCRLRLRGVATNIDQPTDNELSKL